MLNSTEKVFGAVLSFNKNEEDTDSVFTALEVIDDKNIFPFAIDPFGNYICLNLEKQVVVFGDHETNEVLSTNQELETFLRGLY